MTIKTKGRHNKALTWHILKKLDFHNASIHTNQNATVHTQIQRHMRIFSVINLVYHNDLTKIVNTITYCERANHKKYPPTSLQKDKRMTLKKKKKKSSKEDREGNFREKGCFLWIKRSPFGHSGLLGLWIRYSIHAHRKLAYTHLSMTVISSTLPSYFLAHPCAEPRSRPPTSSFMIA